MWKQAFETREHVLAHKKKKSRNRSRTKKNKREKIEARRKRDDELKKIRAYY